MHDVLAVGRHQVAVRGRDVHVIDRGHLDDDVGLGRPQLGDDPARPGQRAGELVRRSDRHELEGIVERRAKYCQKPTGSFEF